MISGVMFFPVILHIKNLEMLSGTIFFWPIVTI